MIFKFLAILTLGVIAYQDFRQFSFYAFLLFLLLLAFIGDAVTFYSLPFALTSFLWNLLVCAIFFSGISLYSILKHKRLINPFENMIGLGDVLMLIVLGAGMDQMTFIWFVILSSVASLLAAAIYLLRSKREWNMKIPFAGVQSLLLTPVFILELITGRGFRFGFVEEYLSSF